LSLDNDSVQRQDTTTMTHNNARETEKQTAHRQASRNHGALAPPKFLQRATAYSVYRPIVIMLIMIAAVITVCCKT